MKRRVYKILNLILTTSLLITGLFIGDDLVMTVHATTIKEVEEQIQNTKNELEGIHDKIDTLSDEQDILYERMDDLNSEIINTMAQIGILEDQIAQKETDIARTQLEYEAAVEKQKEQESAMALHIQMMYEKGTSSLLKLLLKSESFGDFLNKVDYALNFYQYENDMLESFIANKEHIHSIWDQLEADKASLEVDKATMEEQKAYCDSLMEQLKKEAADYDSLIAKAKREAKNAEALLKKEQEQLKKLQEEERRKQQVTNTHNLTYAKTNYTDIIDAASGSDLGKKIAKYGCQYIGNKYVYGGTSLENGTDCSGFTYRIYKNFGYDIPRTSSQQRSAGKSVSYENAEPGDLICYDGHVGLYMGGGYIVHASNARSGIKVSKATYRKILAVRRIIE